MLSILPPPPVVVEKLWHLMSRVFIDFVAHLFQTSHLPPHLTSVLSRRFLALLYVNSAGGDDTEIPQSRDESFFSIDGDHYLPISPPRFLT